MMEEHEFVTLADETLERLNDDFNDIMEEHDESGDFDVIHNDGVLTFDMAGNGTYVINKQTPNRQIWLSSPTTGPKRYDFNVSSCSWVYSHDNVSLHDRLSSELGEIVGKPVKLVPVDP